MVLLKLKKKMSILLQENILPEKTNLRNRSIVIPLTGFDLQRSEDGLFKSGPAMLNISQLSFTIDSLNKKYIEKLNTQFKDFKNLKLYAVRNIRSNYPDQTGMPDPVKKIIKFDTKVSLRFTYSNGKKNGSCHGQLRT